MNRARRKLLEAAKEHITTALDIVREVYADEEEAKDNLPESLQNGEKGEKMQEAIDALETIADALETAQADIDEVIIL